MNPQACPLLSSRKRLPLQAVGQLTEGTVIGHALTAEIFSGARFISAGASLLVFFLIRAIFGFGWH